MKDLGNSFIELIDRAPTEVITYVGDLLDRVNSGEAPQNHIGGNFIEELGGQMLLVETEDDLKKVYTASESMLPIDQQDESCGGWASIVERADSFDVCEWIDKNESYVIILLCTCNAGGTSFFIPKALADRCENISKSIELTKKAWNVS